VNGPSSYLISLPIFSPWAWPVSCCSHLLAAPKPWRRRAEPKPWLRRPWGPPWGTLNDVLEEATVAYLEQKEAQDPDAALFIRRANEPLADCLAAIERRISKIKKHRA